MFSRGKSALNDAMIGRAMIMTLRRMNESDLDFRSLMERLGSADRVMRVQIIESGWHRDYSMTEHGFTMVTNTVTPDLTVHFKREFYADVLKGRYEVTGPDGQRRPIPADMLMKQAWAVGDIVVEGENFIRDLDTLTILIAEIVGQLGPVGKLLGVREVP